MTGKTILKLPVKGASLAIGTCNFELFSNHKITLQKCEYIRMCTLQQQLAGLAYFEKKKSGSISMIKALQALHDAPPLR